MGSGGKFVETPVPLGAIVEAYAALGNLRDALDKTESLIDHLGNNPDDPSGWEGLEVWEGRVKGRSITLVSILRKMRKSQEG